MKKILARLDQVLIILFFINVTGSLLLQTVGRIFGFAFSWTHEFACFNFVWLVFIGAAIVYKNNEHISVSYFTDRMPAPVRRVLFLFRHFVMLATLIILLKPAFVYALKGISMRSSAMLIPLVLVDASVFVCFLLLIYQMAKSLIKGLRQYRQGAK